MIFRTLSMAGFKSFAEKAEMEIETGLTGIVGPNGCGKSNIVEGLRFVMGESSARQMRGTELDDIIFAGTDARPSRNLAEITLHLDNQMKKAPAEYNQYDELEITRKVERGKGSSFQINGKPARARDIQLLFADSATGARSAGIVSQGRIGAIVGAKPEDRRSLIEEAANIKGLHQRRHEAELRLRNTENNLERIEDMIAQLAEQRQQLAKQARQAARYRSVADRIRKAEARLALARWQHLEAESKKAGVELAEQQQKVEHTTALSAQAATRQAELASSLPPLRNAEAEQAAIVQNLRIELGECDREAERIAEALARLDRQIAQITSDAEREGSLHEDAAAALKSLNEERDMLAAKTARDAPRLEEAARTREEMRLTSQQAEQKVAEAQSRKATAEQTKQQLTHRQAELERRLQMAIDELDKLNLENLGKDAATAETEKNKAEEEAGRAQTSLKACEDALAEKTALRDEMALARNEADASLARITAEMDALSYLLLENARHSGTPAADSLTITDGMELALSVVLGTDLALPFDSGEQGYWRQDLPQIDTLTAPPVGTPLTQMISGSPTLLRALQGVSVVEEAEANTAQTNLLPGQMLVSKSGKLWRWDGLIRKGEASSEAERMRQRQRLSQLGVEAESAKASFADKQKALDEAGAAHAENLNQYRALQEQSRQANAAADNARRSFDSAQMAQMTARTRASDLETAKQNAQNDLDALKDNEWLEIDTEALAEQAEAAAQMALQARLKFDEAVSTETELRQNVSAAQQRQKTIEAQISDWQARLADTDKRKQEMASRAQQAKEERTALAERPKTLEARKHQLAEKLEAEEQNRQEKSDALREAEAALSEADSRQREAERQLMQNRETLIRAEALSERLQSEQASLTERIAEKLGCAPGGLYELAQQDEDAALAEPLEKLEMAVNRLINERDQIGPVNLRAEVEMTELEERVTNLQTEHDDLSEAIAKLRSAIATLNREGRARLMESFAAVNRHFTELFTTLFGGGHAELQLTGSDDPLQAGLDILASPPGKKMQSLSLLSGGEQALTALAIIFAVFLTNPAPICILDEVDAPLDDSNVARFCDLLRQISEQTKTRFLVVTHHRMTMARMDRLFGVTMEQKGISRLVSVDLQTAEELQDNLIA